MRIRLHSLTILAIALFLGACERPNLEPTEGGYSARAERSPQEPAITGAAPDTERIAPHEGLAPADTSPIR